MNATSTDVNEDGMATISYVLATGLSLIAISWCAVFIVMSYTRASIRNAAQDASRAGVVAYTQSKDATTAVVACQNAFENNLSSSLPSNVRSGITNDCSITGSSVSVHTTGSLKSVSILFPAFSVNETSRRPLESFP